MSTALNNGGQLLAYESFDVSGDAPEMRDASRFRDEQKSAFMQGDIRNPVLNNCPNFDCQRDWRRNLYQETGSLMHAQTLRRVEGQPETLEDRLLDAMIALRINELGFVETAALIAEGDLAEDERQEMAGVLKEAARDIYGMPEQNMALSLIGARLDKAREIAEDANHPAQAIADELLGMVVMPDYDPQPVDVRMEEAAAAYYQQLLRDDIGKAIEYSFADVGPKDQYSVEEMKDIFMRYMDARTFSRHGWHPEIIPNRTACAAKANEQIVEIGEARPVSSRKFNAVLESEIHEIEFHVGRQVRGKQLSSGLAEFGLPLYGVFEEPLASTAASLYATGSVKAAGVPIDVALGLAAGYDSGRERDFRGTFEAMWRLSLAETYKADAPLEEQITKVQNSSYSSLVRIWRGMPTDMPGCVFPKDRMYDNHEVVKYLNNGGKVLPRADFLRLLQAKYNPLDPDQDAYIRSLTR